MKKAKEEGLKTKHTGTKKQSGFLIRHIGDVAFVFAKNIFGSSETKAHAKTVIAKQDTGVWTNFNEHPERD